MRGHLGCRERRLWGAGGGGVWAAVGCGRRCGVGEGSVGRSGGVLLTSLTPSALILKVLSSATAASFSAIASARAAPLSPATVATFSVVDWGRVGRKRGQAKDGVGGSE